MRLMFPRLIMMAMLALGSQSRGVAQQAAPPASPVPASPIPAPPAAPIPAVPEAPSGEMKTLQARPALRLKGQTSWDGGFDAMKKGFAALEAEATRLALPRLDHPLAHFLDSDDVGFTYEVLLPVGTIPAGLVFSPEIDAAQTPAGQVVIFPYNGPYNDIDAAYEAITAWLDDKNLVATGTFLETYLALPDTGDDPGLKLTISVFLK